MELLQLFPLKMYILEQTIINQTCNRKEKPPTMKIKKTMRKYLKLQTNKTPKTVNMLIKVTELNGAISSSSI